VVDQPRSRSDLQVARPNLAFFIMGGMISLILAATAAGGLRILAGRRREREIHGPILA
jgi:hypothetical protein